MSDRAKFAIRDRTTFMHPRFATCCLVVLAVTSLACDKRPPDDQSDESKATASSTSDTEAESEDTSQSKTDEASEDTPADNRAGRWKINDVHTHIGSTAYPIVEKIMKREKIFRVANMSGGSSPEEWNRQLRTPPELTNRVAPYFTPEWSKADDPDFGKKMADKLEAAVERGYAGLKISKALGLGAKNADGDLLDVDAAKLDPLWARAGELGVPVTIHTGDPKAFFKKPGPDNERHEELKLAPHWSAHGEKYPPRKELLAERDRMIARHRETTFVLAHMANNPEDMEYVRKLLEQNPNVYVDTAARVAEFGRHPAEQIRQFFIDFQDRILFGSDLGVQARARADQLFYSLFLGSISKEPPSLDDVPPFFDKHCQYFETDKKAVAHPIPIQ
ncbi:MAG: amidohydrolase family protein, partial [Bradymonadaceae bacterium]